MREVRSGWQLSVRRLARAFGVAVSTVGRWIGPPKSRPRKRHKCPVSGDGQLRLLVKKLCLEERYQSYGYRRIRALLKRLHGVHLSSKTVNRIMREEGLSRPRVWHRPYRPKRVAKMQPKRSNESWQIDMTSFPLAHLVGLFLVVVIDCYTRQIVGWTLDRRCRASEWVSALRMGLEAQALTSKQACSALVLRSDNGAQPCSKKFIEYLGHTGVRGEYTGYNAPDDNAVVERVIRTIKEEEIWLNQYETFSEAHQAIDEYIQFYNQERIHSALGYQTPDEFAAAQVTLVAA